MRLHLAIAILGLAASGVWGGELPSSSPEAHGFDSAKLAEVLRSARATGEPVHSLLLMRGGEVLLDADFYPYDGSTLHDVASVTKSVTTSLIGIAADEGLLDLDAPILSFFPDRTVANLDERKQAITVRDLTRNLSGLACIGYPEEVTLARMQASPDFVQFALDLPMAHEPGTHFDYCSPGMHLLSAILQQATGMTTFAFGQEELFEPLNITDAAWDADPQGVTRGWGDLHLTPADMARLGLMWLEGGEWEGRQLVPADWLKTATTEAVRSDRYEDYGHGFWIGPKDEPIPYFFASGRGGQRILAAAALDLVIVTTGGGVDPGTLIDAAVGALADPGGALPANPAGESEFASALREIAAAPPALPVLESPLASAISGKVFTFEANPYGIVSLELEFPGGPEALVTLTVGDDATPRPTGLDGRYRWSDGPNGVRYGERARWQDDRTLVVDHNTIGDINAYTITTRFAGDGVDMTIEQRDEPLTVRLEGKAL